MRHGSVGVAARDRGRALKIGIVCTIAVCACGRIAFDPTGTGTSSDGDVDASPTTTGGSWTPTSMTNAPQGRYWHTGVWSGTELIVFGGTTANGANHVNTGGRYDPAVDQWTATSTTNAPMTRSWHSAIWTGTQMIVWGGRGPNNTGGRYDPGLDTWTATSTTNAPSPRWNHTAVWTGSRMIVWGGYANVPVVYNTGGIYDPVSDSWTPTSTTGAPSPRNGHIAVWTGTKMIVWGGCSTDNLCSSGTFPTDGGIYDPVTNGWMPTSTVGAPAARAFARAAWLGGSFGRLLVWGGRLGDGSLTNTGGLYDPVTDTWSAITTANAPDPRVSFSATWTGNWFVVWGGYLAAPVTINGGLYDPRRDEWTRMTDAAAPPSCSEPLGPSTVWTGSQVIIWGGDGPNSGDNTGGVFAP